MKSRLIWHTLKKVDLFTYERKTTESNIKGTPTLSWSHPGAAPIFPIIQFLSFCLMHSSKLLFFNLRILHFNPSARLLHCNLPNYLSLRILSTCFTSSASSELRVHPNICKCKHYSSFVGMNSTLQPTIAANTSDKNLLCASLVIIIVIFTVMLCSCFVIKSVHEQDAGWRGWKTEVRCELSARGEHIEEAHHRAVKKPAQYKWHIAFQSAL